MKKFSTFAIAALLSVSFLIPTNALAAGIPTTPDAVRTTSTTTTVLDVTQVGINESVESKFFYINTPGTLLVDVTQSINKSYPAKASYLIVKPEPDGTATTWGGSTFEGNGSFSFTSKAPLPVGTYYIKMTSKELGRTSSKVTVTIP
ncbi:hypothetical protein [Brevibacillus brevis]|uniref:Uncharacterized protein n=1 Tax=Brevibacillus brevis TaxID=1393 RepID=A0ABY9T861_BREBE|nr:hypothetical protein [Brevibacillus brevis]WNC16270.1 hypothetical protein RGB73_08120 [Brevibacillus brevis]